jgi:RND family efflux transporter MFP subunit
MGVRENLVLARVVEMGESTRMRRHGVLVMVGWCVVAAGCGMDKPVPAAPRQTPAIPVGPAVQQPPATKTAAEKSEGYQTFSGPIIVEHQVEMLAQRDGTVQKIFFDATARVKAGTLLAQLDDRQTLANLEAARAKSRSIEADLKNWESEAQVLEADYGRQQQLWALGLTSQEQLQHAKYKAESDKWDIKRVTESLNTARQEERSLEIEAEKTKIVAPFDGVVARRYVRAGQNVNKGDRLFWVTAEAPLLMRFTLPEKLFGRLQRGQELHVTSPDVPGEQHLARVKEVSPVVDPSSGTFEALVEFVGDRGTLRPGMTANVQLETPR